MRPSVIAVALLVPSLVLACAREDQTKFEHRVCFTRETRGLPSLPQGYRLKFETSPRSSWGAWEKAIVAEAERQVARLNLSADQPAPEFRLLVQPGGVHIGLGLVAGIVCPMGSKGEDCRNRNFFTRGEIDPSALARIVVRDALADRPAVKRCKLRPVNPVR